MEEVSEEDDEDEGSGKGLAERLLDISKKNAASALQPTQHQTDSALLVVPESTQKKKRKQRKIDFQDEFMAHYEEFSQSWRDAINK